MNRTDLQIMSAEPVDVVLGEQSFKIAPQVKKYNRLFCERLAEVLVGVEAAVRTFDDVQRVDLTQIDATRVVAVVKQFLTASGPAALDLLYVYSKELEDSREYIEDNATVDQCLDALVPCFRMAFGPFAKLTRTLMTMSGQTKSANTTSDTTNQ